MSTVKMAKLEQLTLTQKLIIQPHALRGNYLQTNLPTLTATGIVIEMIP